MGHDQSRITPIRGRYNFSRENSEAIFGPGFDEYSLDIDFKSELFSADANEAVQNHDPPRDEFIAELCLKPSLLTSNSSVNEVWQSVLCPLMVGPPESRPHLQQLLTNYSKYLIDKSNNIYENERRRQTLEHERVVEERRAVIKAHNDTIPDDAVRLCMDHLHMLKSQTEITKFVRSFLELMHKRALTPHIEFLAVSEEICNALKESVNDQFAYVTVRWGLASADIAPVIDGFIAMARLALEYRFTNSKISFQMLVPSLPSISLANGCFVPSQDGVIGSVDMDRVELSVTPCSSSLFSDGRNLFILGRRASLTTISVSHVGRSKNDRIATRNLGIPGKARSNFAVTGGNGYIVVLGKLLSKEVIFRQDPFEMIEEAATYQSDSLFGTPKLKIPVTSDGYYIYSLDSSRRVGVFSIEQPPVIRFHKFVEFQEGSSPLIAPYDKCLVPKEWISQAATYTNGIVYSFLVLRRSDHNVFSYFTRHFSLIDGTHIADIVFPLKWPILALTIDPWNDCFWAISPNQERTNVVKLSLTCSTSPWFVGTSMNLVPSMKDLVASFNESGSLDSAAVAINNYLTFYSAYFFCSSFKNVKFNPQYRTSTAFTFAACTQHAIDSLLDGICFFQNALSNLRKSFWSIHRLHSAMISLVKLLQYNLQNIELRIDQDGRSVVVLYSPMKVVEVLLNVLSDKKVQFVHRLVAYTLLKSSPVLFCDDKSMCPKVFSAIYATVGLDMIYFSTQTMNRQPFFAYSLSPDQCEAFITPIFQSMSSEVGKHSMSIEWLFSFQNALIREILNSLKSGSSHNRDDEVLHAVFINYCILLMKHCSSYMNGFKQYQEQRIEMFPIFKLFNYWMILMHPIMKYSRVASRLIDHFHELFNSLLGNINNWKVDQPISSRKPGFRTIYQVFYHIFALFLEGISTLLDGGCELSDTKRYAWLVKSTITSGILDKDIVCLMRTMFTEGYDENQGLLEQGLSFNLKGNIPMSSVRDGKLLKDCVATEAPPYVMNLFKYIYETVSNRFNRRLTEEDMHFERVVFSALMKQLGFLFEMTHLVSALESGSKPTLAYYMRRAMETVYRIRGVMNMSKQITRQMQERAETEAISRPSQPDSLKGNYHAYRNEVLKKCVYLLNIQPCLRFSNQDFEQAFTVYLKRIELFLVSETPLKDYLDLIASSEEAKSNVSHGLELIKGIVTSKMRLECRGVAIDRLASHDHFLNFLLGLSGEYLDDMTAANLKTMSSLLRSLSDNLFPIECVSSQIVFFLNLVLVMAKMKTSRIFRPLTKLWTKLNEIKSYLTIAQWLSYRAFIVSAIHIVYCQDPTITENERFQQLINASIPRDKLAEADLAVMRFAMRMNLEISSCSPRNLMSLLLKTAPRYYHSVCELLADAVVRSGDGANPDTVFSLLNFISQIAGGGHAHLLNGADSYVAADFQDRGTITCQTPQIILLSCSEVIQVVRQLFDSQQSEQVKSLFSKVIDTAVGSLSGTDIRAFDRWNDPTLLFGVFAVLSNTIQTIGINTIAMNGESNTMFYITDIDEQSQQVLGWNLPITPQSSRQTLSRGKRLTPIPAIPFASDMFPATEGLINLFISHLVQPQDGIMESVSFYILNSLKEYSKHPAFANMLIEKISSSFMAKDIGLNQTALGNSDSEFLEILTSHLRVAEGGFLNAVMGPKNGFMLASPTDCIPSNFQAGRNFLKSTSGLAYFVTDLLDTHSPSTLAITPEGDAMFDVGMITLSRHPSNSRILAVFAHDDETTIIGLHKRSVRQAVSTVEMEFSPETKMATLSLKTDVEIHKAKVYFQTQQVIFFVILYNESHVQYVFNNGVNIGKVKSSSLSLQNVRRVQLVKPKDLVDETEMHRFSVSEIPLIEYPKSVTRRIEPSLQSITRTVEAVEPVKTIAVTFSDMSPVGFKIPTGVCYVSTDRSLLISRVLTVDSVPFVHRYSGNVERKHASEFVDMEYLLPLHFTTFPILPPTLLNRYSSLVVSKLRKEGLVQLFLHGMTGPSLVFEKTLKTLCPSTSSMIQLLGSLLLYVEPVNPMNIQNGNSPIDFWHRATDSDVSSRQAHTVHRIVLKRLMEYMASEKRIVKLTSKWLQLLDGMFNHVYSHSVQIGHPTAVVLPFCDLVTPVSVFHKHASSWFVFQSGFVGGGVSNAVIITDNDTEIALSDNVICVKGNRFRACVKSRFSQRSLIAIPFVRNRKDLLFGTVFDLLICLKYFVIFVKTHEQSYDMEFLKHAKSEVYRCFFDALTARSPFFVTFGGEILQFLQQNMPITTSDMTVEFINKLSLLSIYTPKDGMEYVTQFIEEQQNVLDEVYVFGGQDFFNDLFVPAKSAANTPSTNGAMKLFNDPFPNSVSDNDKRGKVLGNLKRVFIKRKDVHSCPFHLLLHRWAHFSLLCPAVEITVMHANVCRVKFQYYIPKSFTIVFTTTPTTIRLQVSDNSHFRHPRYLTPGSIIQTNGKSEIFIQILDDETVTFHNLSFYIRSDNIVPFEEFVRDYRTQFVLDAKTFFIHWDNRIDQMILKCFSVKQYLKSTLVLDFDPVNLARFKFTQPMSLLCCRYFFLMILNYYYAHDRSIFAKDAAMNACLDSISMRLKLDRFKHMVAKSNAVESDYVRVNRKNAFEVRDGQSKKLTHTLIFQLTQLYTSPAQFRVSGDKPWRVHLIGEHGCDVGGLARELVAEAAADLMCPLCGLVVPIPNARDDENSPALMIPIPNERHRDPLRQYKFAGALIAIAIRSGLSQDFNFAPLVWQYLLTQRITIESIYSIDHNFHSLITSLKQALESPGTTEDAIERFNLKFVIQDSMGRETLLTPNGMDECVNIHNCERFISMAIEFRLNEMKNYLNAMSTGLWENFAMKPPRSIDWTTIEYAACGEKEISTDLLKQVTTFDDVPPDQQDLFWRVIERFSNEQRSLLLKFVTGRVKLPLHSKSSKILKVDASFGHVDKMPTASTCFNQLHLPRYTSLERARKMIALAIEYTGTFEMG